MFDKILTALKAKYQDKRLPDKVLGAIAKRLAATITDEALIEEAVTAEGETIAEFQSHASARYAAGEQAAKKPSDEPGKDKPNGGADPGNGNDQMPAWFKPFADKVNALEAGKTVDSRRTQLETALKDAPEAYRKAQLKAFDRMQFSDDADFATYLGEATEDAKAQGQNDANQQLGGMGRPGQPAVQATAKQVDADIAKWAADNKPAEAAKA